MRDDIASLLFEPNWLLYILTSLSIAGVVLFGLLLGFFLVRRFFSFPATLSIGLVDGALLFAVVLGVLALVSIYAKDRWNAGLEADRLISLAALPSEKRSVRVGTDGTVKVSERVSFTNPKGEHITFERNEIVLSSPDFIKSWPLLTAEVEPPLALDSIAIPSPAQGETTAAP